MVKLFPGLSLPLSKSLLFVCLMFNGFLLRKICQNTGFFQYVLFRIGIESFILSLYGKRRIKEKLHYDIFYAVFQNLWYIVEHINRCLLTERLNYF